MSHVDEGLLHAYLDGELTPVERARVDEHLAACPACRTRRDEEQALIERAAKLLGLATPSDRLSPPLSALARPRPWWHIRLPVAWAATVILAIGLGWTLATQVSPRRAPETLGGPIGLRQAPQEQQQTPAAPAVAQQGRLDRPRTAARAQHSAPPPALADNAGVPDTTRAADKIVAATTGGAPAPAAAPPRNLAPRAMVQRVEVDELAPATLDSAAARAMLGRDPSVIPGLAVLRVTRSSRWPDEVRVEQALDATQTVVLWERPIVPAPRDAAPVAQRGATLAKSAPDYVGVGRAIAGVWVQITGGLSADSLRQLLGKIGATQSAPPPR